MISRPLGNSSIGVSVNAGGNGVLLQISDADGEQARAVLREVDVAVLIGWLQREVAAMPAQRDKHKGILARIGQEPNP